MKQILKAGLILTAAIALSLTMANAKYGGATKEAPKTMKCQAGMDKKADANKSAKPKAAGKCGQGKCGGGK